MRAYLIALLLFVPTAHAQRFDFNLEDASLADVARILTRLTGEPVVISSGLNDVQDCVTLSVASSAPMPLRRALALVRAGVADAGIELARTRDGYLFRPRRGATLTCPRRHRPANAPADMAAEPPPSPPQGPAAPATGVRQRSDTSFVLTREALERAISGAGIRLIPHEESGRVVGLRVYGIRSASLHGVLGLQNGDLLRSVNGTLVTDEGILAVLRRERVLELELTRRGASLRLRYEVVDALPE